MPRTNERAFRLQPETTVFQPVPPFAEATEGRLAAATEPSLFASSIEEPRRRSGVSLWLTAAAALVIGIGVGFASGYRAGTGSTSAAAPAVENPAPTSEATSGQPFSESSVPEPVNLNPEPIVPAPDVPAGVPAGPLRGLKPAAEPAPRSGEVLKPAQPSPRQGVKPAPASPAGPPRRIERAAEPAPRKDQDPKPLAVGPASLQVDSRPWGAQVFLDGRAIGKTPMTIPDLAAGAHNIRLELPGFKGWATTVDVKAGVATRVAASLEQ